MNVKTIKNNIPLLMSSVTQANIAGSAAEMTYYLILSLFPVLLMIANVIPLLPIDQQMIIDLFKDFLPNQIESLLIPTLENYLNSSNPEVASLGFVLSIWSASVAFNTLQNVLNRVYAIENTGNFLVTRVLSFLLALLLVVAVGALSIVFVFGQTILEFLDGIIPVSDQIFTLFAGLRWPLMLIGLLLMMIYIYQFIPKHRYPIKYSIPGAITASLLLLLLSSFFSLYIQYFGGNSVSNGTIGVFIVLMLYLYISSISIIAGALINQLIYKIKHIEQFKDKSIRPEMYKSENYPQTYGSSIYNGAFTRHNVD